LTFYNKGVKYSVYQKKSDNQIIDIGVKVFEKGKLTDIKGDLNTLNGQLNWSELLDLDNVYNKK
ncbi:MAG: hypothetical protein K9I84_10755, partial [Leadbetterella sp.]|nr:hypothetical protein [Leadbetterella sp.]